MTNNIIYVQADDVYLIEYDENSKWLAVYKNNEHIVVMVNISRKTFNDIRNRIVIKKQEVIL